MSSKKVAQVLSEVLGPLFWMPAIVLAFLLKGGLTFAKIQLLFPTILILQVIIPLSYIYYFSTRWHLTTAWDEPKRSERYPLLILLVFCFLVSILAVYKFGNPLLFHLELIILILIIILFVITLFWKISLHMSMNTAGSILINFLYSFQLPFLFLAIPLIYWARLKLKSHNNYQLLAAFFLSAVVTLGGLYLSGELTLK